MGNKVFVVAPRRNAEGLLTLHRPGPDGQIALRPGHYLVQVRRYGLGDPVFVGTSDRISAGLHAGGTKVHATARASNASKIDQLLKRLDDDVKLDAGASVPLGLSLVMDRGKGPEVLDALTKAVLGKLPDGSSAGLAAAAIGGSLGGFAVAAAAAAVAGAAAGLGSLFGEHVLLSEKGALVGDPGGPGGGVALCLMSLPKSEYFGLEDFGLEPDTWLLYETLRDRSAYNESRTFRGYTRSKDFPYAVVTLAPT